MAQQLFKISEVAKLHNITKKTLQYYDAIGLFRPHVTDEQTGYRYYTHTQFPYLKQIIYLKDVGLDLEQIDYVLKHRTFDVILKTLDQRRETVRMQQTQLAHNMENLEYLINFYRRARYLDERDLYKPGITIMEQRRAIIEPCIPPANRLAVMLAYRKALKTLYHHNIFSQMDYGTVYEEAGLINQTIAQHCGSFILLPRFYHLEEEVEIPEGKYATMYKKGGYYDEYSVSVLMRWIREQGYEPVGNMYDFCLIDYTFTNDEDEMVQQLLIKIC